MSEKRPSGDELSRWARELAERIREVVEDSIGMITPEVERILGRASVEKDGFLYLRVVMPGCDKSSINVLIKDDVVEVTASPAEPPYREAKELQVFSKPIRKVIRLPRKVSPEESEAKYVDGVLYLKLKPSGAGGVVIKVE